MNHRGIVAVIIAATVGVGILLALTFTLGPWTPEPTEAVAMELLALIAAALGAISVYLGMTYGGTDTGTDPDPYDYSDEHDDDPEAEADDTPPPGTGNPPV